MQTFEEWKAARIAKDPALRRSTDTFLRQLYIRQVGADDLSESEARENQAVDAVLVTTTPELPGFRVVRALDIVTAESVFGMNVFRDLLAQMSDFFGGRSEATQRVLRDARTTCLRELRKEAVRLGGNAVIGVDLDYSDFSGQGNSMLFLVASGTAVIVEPSVRQPNEEL
jgi:uncharacterized protein YbjQ (UPF0145 family)